MKQREQRKFIRYDSLHLLDYLVLDEEGNPSTYSMGRTMDVSIDGIKLETTTPFKTDTRLLITVGIEDDLVDLEGRTTHSQPHDGRYISGITFLKITKNGRRVFAKYVEAFRQRKRELQEKLNGAAE
jgi:phage terminase large subunit-like protein